MVSVIIPCRNDDVTLGEVLESLNHQTYPRSCFEVIVVDNGSLDRSREIARAHPVVLLEEPVPSAYVARNRAIAAARGVYLLFIDADTVPCATWIEHMVTAAARGETGMAGGRIENRIDRFTLGSVLLALTHDPDKRRASVEQDGRLSGGNMIVKKALFDRYGLFLAVQSGADGEFSTRANPERKPVPYAALAVVMHVCNIGTYDYIKRAFREGFGQARTMLAGKAIRPPLPWRPGFRRAAEMCNKIVLNFGSNLGRMLLPRVFLVLWIERWCFYFGVCSGRMAKR